MRVAGLCIAFALALTFALALALVLAFAVKYKREDREGSGKREAAQRCAQSGFIAACILIDAADDSACAKSDEKIIEFSSFVFIRESNLDSRVDRNRQRQVHIV